MLCCTALHIARAPPPPLLLLLLITALVHTRNECARLNSRARAPTRLRALCLRGAARREAVVLRVVPVSFCELLVLRRREVRPSPALYCTRKVQTRPDETRPDDVLYGTSDTPTLDYSSDLLCLDIPSEFLSEPEPQCDTYRYTICTVYERVYVLECTAGRSNLIN